MKEFSSEKKKQNSTIGDAETKIDTIQHVHDKNLDRVMK